MIQDLSWSWCIKRTGESMTRVDSPVSLMYHDPDRSWITDPDPDYPKGTCLRLIYLLDSDMIETQKNYLNKFGSEFSQDPIFFLISTCFPKFVFKPWLHLLYCVLGQSIWFLQWLFFILEYKWVPTNFQCILTKGFDEACISPRGRAALVVFLQACSQPLGITWE